VHAHDTDELLARLRDAGVRATTQRRVILEALAEAPAHVTAEELTVAVNRRFPEVHAATVYRTLELLETAGVLYRLEHGHAPTQWHLTDEAHQHLVCEGCGTIIQVSHPAFAHLARSLARDHGFTADLHHMAITGSCARCAASAPSRT
jgi:Fe2+ or Zn2+ uptake regulation protein